MSKNIKNFVQISILAMIPTILIWMPFFLRAKSIFGIPLPPDGMATIIANYDGPLYIVVAKTLYNIDAIKELYSFPLPAQYYAAHFPLYPVLIRITSVFTGYPYALLTITVLSSVLAIYFFHKFITKYVGKKNALWATFVFAIFPARWLVVRSIGSPEPLFIATIIASVYYFQKKKFWLAGLWGVLAQLTKSPGIILFIAYLAAIFIPKIKGIENMSVSKWVRTLTIKKAYPIFLIPLSLLLLFFFYGIQFNDFLAYFNSGDNIHLMVLPFQVFNYSQPWVGTFWLEEIIFIYLIMLLGLTRLISQKSKILVWFIGIFLISIFFVSHRDIVRYSLPIVPFMFAAYSDLIVKREFKIIMIVLIIPIYLFSLAFISQNTMPIADWGPLL
jgi:Gpi18-like mannosyltransferase